MILSVTCSGSSESASIMVPMPFLRSSVRPTKSMSASFSTSGQGRKISGSVPLYTTGTSFSGNVEVALDLRARRLTHRDDARKARRDLLLHEEREVEGALDLLDEARVDGEVRLAVDVQRDGGSPTPPGTPMAWIASSPQLRLWLSKTTSKR